MNRTYELATFAAGCFWGVEHTFQQQPGVISTMVGYTGGTTENPSYQQVCSHETGHAEAVRIEFDPQQTNFETLLTIFWSCHNPTQRHGQGPDIGSQYRSAIFYHNDTQKKLAEASKQALEKNGKFTDSIATEISPANAFYKAEEYHQHYIEKNGGGHCKI